MAIIRTSGIVTAISGSIGGQTFVTARRGAVVRIRPKMPSANSESQLIQQAHFQNAINAWRSLTNQQRAAWRALAKNFPRTNRLGQTSALSGYNYFLKVALNGLRIWGWQFLDPPEVLPVAKLTVLSAAFSASGPYDVSHDSEGINYIARLQVFGARHFSTVHPKFTGTWRQIAILATAGGAARTDNIRDEWESVFGLMEPGEAFSIRAVLHNSCVELLPPPPRDASSNVTTP